jgi:CubicO group peptidase (beta-lactamase class C family)
MSEAGCRRVLEQQVEGPDLVMRGIETRFGLGFGLPCPLLRLTPPTPDTAFWGGGGGSLVLIDYANRAVFAYAMNRMVPTTVGDERSFRVVRAMWRAMGLPAGDAPPA